ncbi:hypothetical protein ABPG75_002757 [Micractinium tetrahymenae]
MQAAAALPVPAAPLLPAAQPLPHQLLLGQFGTAAAQNVPSAATGLGSLDDALPPPLLQPPLLPLPLLRVEELQAGALGPVRAAAPAWPLPGWGGTTPGQPPAAPSLAAALAAYFAEHQVEPGSAAARQAVLAAGVQLAAQRKRKPSEQLSDEWFRQRTKELERCCGGSFEDLLGHLRRLATSGTLEQRPQLLAAIGVQPWSREEAAAIMLAAGLSHRQYALLRINLPGGADSAAPLSQVKALLQALAEDEEGFDIYLKPEPEPEHELPG